MKNSYLVLDERPADRLVNTSVTTEAKYSINTINFRKKICLSLHYDVSNRFLYANEVKIHRFKAKKYSEIKSYSLCFGSI